MTVYNSLTIDVEEYFHVANFSSVISPDDWDRQKSRLSFQLDKILSILEVKNVKATFFVLGWIAERHIETIKRMQKAGHEIASHGYGHQLVYDQTPEEFREDIRRSKKILEDIIQEPVWGYRAPNFSITKKSLWALDILIEEGFKYDSSIFPIHRDRGGLPDGERFPYKIERKRRSLLEFPISTIRLLGQNVPYSGGGYFRLLPYCLIKPLVRTNNKEGHTAIIYLHPWEFDPQQPRIKVDPFSRFRHYVNICTTEGKLEKLLNDFQFKTMKELFEA